MSLSKKIIPAMSWDFLGKGALTGLKFIESVILVRLLLSENFGVWASVINIQAVIIFFTSFGLENAISRFGAQFKAEEKWEHLKLLTKRIFELKFIIVLIVAIVVFVFSESIAHWQLHRENAGLYIKIVAFLIITTSLQDILRTFLVIFYRQKFINIIECTQYIFYLIFAVITIKLGWGIAGVLISSLATKLIAFTLFLLKSFYEISQKSKNSKVISLDLRRTINFSWTLYIYTLMNFALGRELSVFLIGKLWTDLKEVTYFVIAFNFAYLSLSFFDMALAGGFSVPLAVEVYSKKDYDGLRKIYTGMFEYLYIFVFPIAIGGIVLGKEILKIVYGAEYICIFTHLTVMFISITITKIGGIPATLFIAMDKEKVMILSRTIFGISNIILSIVLIPKYGAMGSIISSSIAGVSGIIYESVVLHKLLRPSYPLDFLWKVICASGIMGVILYLIKPLLFGLSDYIGLFLAILIGVIIYGFFVIKLKPISREVVDLISTTKIPFKEKLVSMLY